MTPKSKINEWINEGLNEDADYMLVVCDTFDYEDYPVFTSKKKFWLTKDNLGDMQKIMEVYDLNGDIDTQLKEKRAYHPPPRPGNATTNDRDTVQLLINKIENLEEENYRLKEENKKLSNQVFNFIKQEQLPLQVFQYILHVAYRDESLRGVVISENSLRMSRLGERFLSYLKEIENQADF